MNPTPSPLRYVFLRAALARFSLPPGQLDSASREQAWQDAQRQYQIEELALASTEAREIEISAAQVDEALTHVRGRYADEAHFIADIAANDLDLSAFRAALQRELQVEAVLEKVAARAVQVSTLDAKIYYHMHAQRFNRPETRTARHILITINPHYPENTREQAFTRIRSVAKRLQHKPQRFAEQAAKHSECPTAMNGGLLGRVGRGKLYPQLDTALFDLKAGHISSIIESELGFHVLYCEAIHPSGTMPYAEAEALIMTQLQQRRQRICQKHWLNEMQQRKSFQIAQT
jgi:peptidyl-prolyl cis-trans isomerase C